MIGFLPRRPLALVLTLTLLMLATLAFGQGMMVPVRSADHDRYSRVVFDFRRDVAYRVDRRDGEVVVSFELSGDMAFPGLDAIDLDRLASPRIVENDGGLAVAFRASPEIRVRHFTTGNRLVIDAVDASLVETAEIADADVAEDSSDSGDDETPPQGSDVRALSATDQEPRSPPESSEGAGQSVDETRPSVELDATVAPGDLVIALETLPDKARLLFGLSTVVPAAVYQRAGSLWVVFEGRHRIDRSRLATRSQSDLARVRALEIIDDPDAVVLRFDIRPNQGVSADLSDKTWVVTLKDLPGGPRRPLDVARQVTGQAGGRLFISADDVGSRIRIEDPEVGDVIDVVPVGQPSRGVDDERSYAKFALLKTAQGVAVQHLADDVIVRRFRNGVAVSGPQGLALSSPGLDNGTAGRSRGDDVNPLKLIDFDAWKMGSINQFMGIKQRLLRRMARAPRDDRNPIRWDLARFRLAHGQAAEALGVLKLMVENAPELERNAEFLAVRGVARLQAGRYEGAGEDLSHPDLDPEPEAALWRALAAEALGNDREALEEFRRGVDALPFYKPEQRVEFQLAAVRAAMAEGLTDLAAHELDLVQDEPVGPYLSAEVTYWLGRLAEARGNVGLAVARYEDAASSDNRRAAAMARFRRIDFARREEGLEADEAIDQLERLRFAWRGDKFELTLLESLGSLYVETGQYRTGLETLRQAVTHFPEAARSRVITAEMSEAFRALFLDGAADKLKPVEALGLFYDFQELTPLGADGDAMIRRLADRLVSVDLLDRAAELLKHQVTYRLEGAAQALVAVRLAKVYLLDGRADDAVGILRATRQDRLPDDIVRRRKLVEARALVEQSRYEEAEVLIAPYRQPEADLVRLDIAWGAKNWPMLDRVAGRLLGGRHEDPSQLVGIERQFLIRRAIAKTFLEDAPGLRRMRERYKEHMQNGPFASTFDRLTDTESFTPADIQDVIQDVASAEHFHSFLSAYRDDFDGSDTTAGAAAEVLDSSDDQAGDSGAGGGTGLP